MKTFEEARAELLEAIAAREYAPRLAAGWVDRAALNAIQSLMSGEDWSPDILDSIAEIVRLTGRLIEDSAKPEDEK